MACRRMTLASFALKKWSPSLIYWSDAFLPGKFGTGYCRALAGTHLFL